MRWGLPSMHILFLGQYFTPAYSFIHTCEFSTTLCMRKFWNIFRIPELQKIPCLTFTDEPMYQHGRNKVEKTHSAFLAIQIEALRYTRPTLSPTFLHLSHFLHHFIFPFSTHTHRAILNLIVNTYGTGADAYVVRIELQLSFFVYI